MGNNLLDRNDFRESVFKRDNKTCVVCGNPGVDAHHIIERRLFADGGYYLDNGATLCSNCHIEAEKTNISCEQIREAIGIKKAILPEDFYDDVRYDKWGNIYIGQRRTKGSLFHDESVQKILSEHLNDFTDYVKYPRTYHLPWSEGRTKDDRILKNTEHFLGKKVVVTEKMDGENATLYRDYYHARSIDGNGHWTQTWLKNFHSQFAYEIPDGWRICGENLFAKHSIKYNDLKSYFMGFSIWDNDICLSWDDTVQYFDMLKIDHVPVIYHGEWDEDVIMNINLDTSKQEGYVVRLSDKFYYNDFKKSVAKFVRKNHIVDTVHHWKHSNIEKNELVEKSS